MAFKFTVDYQQLKLVIQTDSTEAVNSFEHLKTTVQFIDMQQIVAFQQLTAADVTIDADTLNRYFTAQYNSPNAESFGFTDSDVFSFGKGLGDTPTITEQLANAMQKALTESISVAENFSKVVTYLRDFTESTSVSESHTYAFGKAASDSVSISESQVFDVSTVLADSYSFSDSQVLEMSNLLDDSFSVGESLARTVVYSRDFADAYGLDDTASASDDLATESNLNKTNIVTMAESSAFAFTPGDIAEGISVSESYVSSFVPGDIAEGVSVAEAYVSSFAMGTIAETATISESAAFVFSPVFADTATISESIDVELIRGGGPINVSTLNNSMLNA